jgi:type I restriction enzyme S subunit
MPTPPLFFPDSFEDSPVGKIPKGWRVRSLGEIAEIIMGQSPPGETYNEVGEGLPFYQGIRDFGWRFPSRRVYCTQPTRFAEMGDVLLSVRAPVGSLNIALESCAIGRGLAALRLKPSPGSFLLYLLKSDDAIWEKFEAKGTVFGAATKGDIHSIEVIQPSHSQIIQAFNKIVGSFDARMEAIDNESHILADIRDALLPKLLSGEVRIGNAEKWLEAPR